MFGVGIREVVGEGILIFCFGDLVLFLVGDLRFVYDRWNMLVGCRGFRRRVFRI